MRPHRSNRRARNEPVMEIRRIASLAVSAIGLGCNNFGARLDYARTEAVVHGALDSGITFFDTADIYGEHTGRRISSGARCSAAATRSSSLRNSGCRSTTQRKGPQHPATSAQSARR